ncbi:MAG: hypothetical protein LBV77_01500 [Candidatus Adiutrix intracellularis]|nr:hypothetical protein [Candidatus Adiutrix intracellularis]
MDQIKFTLFEHGDLNENGPMAQILAVVPVVPKAGGGEPKGDVELVDI